MQGAGITELLEKKSARATFNENYGRQGTNGKEKGIQGHRVRLGHCRAGQRKLEQFAKLRKFRPWDRMGEAVVDLKIEQHRNKIVDLPNQKSKEHY